MFRKFNIQKLSVIFAVLLLTVIVTFVVDNSRGVNTLKNLLFEVKTEEITQVVIKPKMLEGDKIILQKDGNNWKVESKGKSYNGDAKVIEGVIEQLNKLKPLRLAAKSRDKWDKFELTDSLSSMVLLMNDKEVLADIYIGKFSYRQAQQNPAMMQNPYNQQPRGTMTTYVRTGNDDEVYAVEGFLASSVNRGVDAFRNKLVLKTSSSELNKISFNYPADSSFTIVKNENKWMSDGVELDSAKVAQYLSSIRLLNASGFTENTPTNYSHSVTIQNNQMQSIEVKAILRNDEAILTSSQNKGSILKEDKSRNFEKLFISKNKLTK